MDPTEGAHHPLPLGRRERKKLETRQRISTAAFALFVERGYEATTVEAIAERADVAKGTVFNYFPQKRPSSPPSPTPGRAASPASWAPWRAGQGRLSTSSSGWPAFPPSSACAIASSRAS